LPGRFLKILFPQHNLLAVDLGGCFVFPINEGAFLRKLAFRRNNSMPLYPRSRKKLATHQKIPFLPLEELWRIIIFEKVIVLPRVDVPAV
jgi:hypothetical protein